PLFNPLFDMKISILIIIFSLLGLNAFPQSREYAYSCLFYNLENMFHPSNDSLESDDDFTPEGVRNWTFYRYNMKLTQICKVILASNGWETPTLICLSELENRQVVEDIVRHPLLMKTSYRILHRDSPDHRGIDVAILYREDKLTCIDTVWLQTKDTNDQLMNTREMLCGKFVLNRDTLLCVANHWTSKYGGELETEAKRMQQAMVLGGFIDSALNSQPGLCIIAGGDFNEASRSKSIKTLISTFHLSEVLPENGNCSYKYQGIWESIDHVFIGGNLFTNNCKATVIKIPFLLEDDVKYTGSMPLRTYRGFKFNGGVSDHLPLLLEFDPGKRQGNLPALVRAQ
ncbi:hypothetical protein ACFLRQ_01025, partial [Bacteroidota bacterium]